MNELIIKLAGMIISGISPEIRKALIEFVTQLDRRAKATTNDWDDVLVFILKIVLNIK